MSPLSTPLILLLVAFVQAQQGYRRLRSSVVTGRGFATPPKHSHSSLGESHSHSSFGEKHSHYSLGEKHSHSSLGDIHSHSYQRDRANNKRQTSFSDPRETPGDWGVISNPYKGLDIKISNNNNKKGVEGVEDWEELNLEEIQSWRRGKGRVNGWQELGSISHPVVEESKEVERLLGQGYRETRPKVELDKVSFRQGGGSSFTPNSHWYGQPAGDTAQIYNNVVKYTQKYNKEPVVFGRLSTNEQTLSSSERFTPTDDWFGEKEEGLLQPLQISNNIPRRKRGHDIHLTNVAQEENTSSFSPNNDWLAVRRNRINGKRQLSYSNPGNEPEIITMDNVHKYIGDNNNNNNVHLADNPGNSFIVSVAAGYSARGPKTQSSS